MATILSGFDDHTLPSFLECPPFPSAGETSAKPKLTPETQSHAVLSALKELQDKIRRLELGKSSAETKIKALATETQKQKERLSITQENVSPKSMTRSQSPSYLTSNHKDISFSSTFSTKENDNLLSSQVENQLKNADTRCKLLEKQLENMRGFVQNAEKERSKALELQLNLEREHGRIAAENHETKSKLLSLKSLQEKYSEMAARKDLSENKVNELEQKLLLEKHQKQLILDKANELEAERKSREIILKEDHSKSRTIAEKPLEDAKPIVKAKKIASKKNSALAKPSFPPHYRLNLADIPFVIGTSTSPSHAVSANVQSLLHDLKHHSPLYCNENVLKNKKKKRTKKKKVSNSDSNVQIKVLSEADEDLNDLLLTLQDEYGKLTYQYQLLGKQLDETYDKQLHDELLDEQKQVTTKMEQKRDQISTLQRHKSLIISCTRPKKLVNNTTKSEIPYKSNKTKNDVGVLKSSPLKVSGKHKKNLNLLREVQTVHSALHEKDLLWD